MKKIIKNKYFIILLVVIIVGVIVGIAVPKGSDDTTVSTEKNLKVCTRYKRCSIPACGCAKAKNKKCVKYKTCQISKCGCASYKK